MLPEHVPRVTSSFLRKPSVAWNSTGLNSCAIKQGQNDLSFECFDMCTVFANCFGYDIKMNQSGVSASYVTSFVLSLQHTSYANLVPGAFPGNEVGPVVHTKGAYPRFTSPSVCRPELLHGMIKMFFFFDENVNEYEDFMSNQNPNLLQGVKDVPSQYKIHTRSLSYLTP